MPHFDPILVLMTAGMVSFDSPSFFLSINATLTQMRTIDTPARVMEDTLSYITKKYGSINGYLDSIGFDITWRRRLRFKLLDLSATSSSIHDASSPILNDK
jgi:hypothetical protein